MNYTLHLFWFHTLIFADLKIIKDLSFPHSPFLSAACMPAACWNPDNWTAFPHQDTQGKSLVTTRFYCWLDFIKIIAKLDCLALGIHWICLIRQLEAWWRLNTISCVSRSGIKKYAWLWHSRVLFCSQAAQETHNLQSSILAALTHAVITPEYKRTWRCRTCLTTALCLEDTSLLTGPLWKPKILMTDLLHLLKMRCERKD